MLYRSENTLQLFGKIVTWSFNVVFCLYFGTSVSRVVFHQDFDADGTRTRLSKIRARGVMCEDLGVLHFSMYLTQELFLKISPRRPSSPQVVGVSLGESRGDVSLSPVQTVGASVGVFFVGCIVVTCHTQSIPGAISSSSVA